jgi:lipopolysaccharide/colanic/teichoic acid biosynthesis glycosyltransferase
MYKIIKRAFDFISALLLFIVISPFFCVLAIIVRIKMGRPIFFHQVRTGKGMKQFGMTKFRTMTNATDSDGNLLPDEERLTKFGKWLRSSSMDELPELLNIIKGEMSVIGPRPLPPLYDDYYTEEEKKRFLVRGGLITPDSVDPQPVISWDKQLAYEADYGENLSFKKDLSIFIGVFRILFRRTTTDYGEFVREPLNVERKNRNI